MNVRYSPRAVRDLAGIADYLVERAPRGAHSVDHRIRKTVALIAAYPGSGRALEQRRGVRVMPVGRYPYLVFYTISKHEIMIRHGARAPVTPDDL